MYIVIPHALDNEERRTISYTVVALVAVFHLVSTLATTHLSHLPKFSYTLNGHMISDELDNENIVLTCKRVKLI